MNGRLMNVFNDGQVSEREKIERNEHQKQLDRELGEGENTAEKGGVDD